MPAEPSPILLSATGLAKTYPSGAGPWSRAGAAVVALSDVSLSVPRGATIAVVGESGSGKTTLGRCIVGLIEPTQGEILYRGQELSRRAYRRSPRLRRAVQMIFQDPSGSLNPRQRVGAIIAEPLSVHGIVPPARIAARVDELLHAVGLGGDAATRYPHEFSGGQKQRIAIARALSLEPELLICDEAVSALDVSVQAQIVNLLKELQRQRNLTYLFISHDMAVVRHIADEIVVMRAGRIVESGPTEDLIGNPQTDYTRALFQAVPRGISMHRKG